MRKTQQQKPAAKPVLILLFFIYCSIVRGAEHSSPAYPSAEKQLAYTMVHNTYEKAKSRESSPLDQTNPLKFVFVFLIRTYQVIFSSQDGSTCQFRPSCSQFGADAIKQQGPVTGLLMTGDRILRCNPFTRGNYFIADDGIHHADPVEDHTLGSTKKE
jgi:putative membrane protein insertion efficiency factor